MKRVATTLLIGLLSMAVGCERGDDANASLASPTSAAPISDTELRSLLADHDVEPLDDIGELDSARVELGRALFFDAELSGNRDTSCATCHNPCATGGDKRSLSVGTGAIEENGVRLPGENRVFIARHATELTNRGDSRWTTMLWDMRISIDEAGHFVEHTPLRTSSALTPPTTRLPAALDNILAAQALLPVTSRDEMRGQPGDVDIFGEPNELAMVPDQDVRQIWARLMDRLLEIDEYRQLFADAFPDLELDELEFVHAANALADFQIQTFSFSDSPFDQYIDGDDDALDDSAHRGAALFYDQAGCATCHTGALLTDQLPHNIGAPQIGPGKEPGEPFDEGVYLRSHGEEQFRFAFRTPPLRNVAATGPWMRNGSYASLEDVIRHHLDPEKYLHHYDPSQLEPKLRAQVRNAPQIREQILDTLSPNLETDRSLSDDEIDDMLAFLQSLTSPSLETLSDKFPDEVPSGLPVETCLTPDASGEVKR